MSGRSSAINRPAAGRRNPPLPLRKRKGVRKGKTWSGRRWRSSGKTWSKSTIEGGGPLITCGREPKRAKHEADDETGEKNAGPDGEGPGGAGPEGSGGHRGRRRGQGPDERAQASAGGGDRPRGGGSGGCGDVAGSD